MTPSTKLDISNWKIPEDLKLVDEQFNEPGIDLLIDADLFYKMSKPGRYTPWQLSSSSRNSAWVDTSWQNTSDHKSKQCTACIHHTR
jgi:uncharacterized phage-associated protein